MRAFDGGEEPKVGAERKSAKWGRREFSYPQRAAQQSSAASARLMERIAARVGFESFERVFVILTGVLVLAGCAIVFNAGFMGLRQEALIEPSIIIAKQDKPAEPESVHISPKPVVTTAPAASAAEVAAPATITPATATPSLLSQTPMRESAREALARASAPAVEPANEGLADATQEPVATQALGYAEAGADKEDVATPHDKSKDAKAEGERVSRCLVKVSGRTLTSGPCRVAHKGQSVTISYGGADVTISPHRGREWTLSVGGRTVGKVYKSGGCWGSRNHTWVCEKA